LDFQSQIEIINQNTSEEDKRSVLHNTECLIEIFYMNTKQKMKWIGLAKVVIENYSKILNGEKSAFTNSIGLATTKCDFRNLVKNTLSSMDLKLIRLEGAEPITERQKNIL
jgi:hypothetical protein